MISIKNIHLSFGSKNILRQSSFEFTGQKISVLLGPSGCGKSTLLKCIAGLIAPPSGSIDLPSKKISFVFQEPRLLPWLNTRENILLPLSLGGASANSDKKKEESVFSALESVGLKNTESLFPHELSGGMKMRASIARALINEPEILLLDEPFSALDESLRSNLQNLLLKIQAQNKLTVVFVTHSFSEAVSLADEIFLMRPEGGGLAYNQKNQVPRDAGGKSSKEYLEAINFWSQKLRENSGDPDARS